MGTDRQLIAPLRNLFDQPVEQRGGEDKAPEQILIGGPLPLLFGEAVEENGLNVGVVAVEKVGDLFGDIGANLLQPVETSPHLIQNSPLSLHVESHRL